MRKIGIFSQKGGTGKTTIATNLAYAIQERGFKTLLVDADPQGSARDWHEANGGVLVPTVGFDRETLPQDLKTVEDSYHYAVIDGSPRFGKLTTAAVKVCDLILIPVQPSPYDVWACAELVEIVKARQEMTEGRPKAFFLVSRAIKNTNLSNEVTDAIKEYELPILAARTTQRVAYASSASEGKTVFHTPDYRAQDEIGDIWVQVRDLT